MGVGNRAAAKKARAQTGCEVQLIEIVAPHFKSSIHLLLTAA
jgi:hypothetical protein